MSITTINNTQTQAPLWLYGAWAAAAEAGLDVDKAREQMNATAIDNVLAQDALDVENVGVRQTPTFFVDGRPLLDFGAEQLIDMVRLQVEAKS